MTSAGNDIVSLRTVDKQRTNQSRFYSQILSGSEQDLYHQPRFSEMPFEHYVWLLWSVKESAYKYVKRNITDLEFSPTKIIIQHIDIPVKALTINLENSRWKGPAYCDEFYRGMVICERQIIYFRSKIDTDWIATVVNDDEGFENVYWGVQIIDESGYSHQSKAARALVLDKLGSFLPGDLQVKKNLAGCPVISKGTQNMHIPVSLAHDDHFVAYSFLLKPDSHCQTQPGVFNSSTSFLSY